MYRTLIIILLLLGKTLTSSGEEINYSFTQLSIEQGLSQPTVKSILLDRKGLLWIGTQGGLSYYSQQGMKTYTHNAEEKLSLPNNLINHIAEDSIGNIWIATPKGLVLYDNKHDRFTPASRGDIYSSLPVRGGILFGSNNVIYYYDYKRQNFKRIYIHNKELNQELSEYRVQKMLPLEENKILIGTKEKGIYLYNYLTGQFSQFSSDSHHLLISLYISSDGYIYASFYGDGLYCYDKSGKMVRHYTSDNSQLNNNYILDMVEHKKQLWLATDGGGINILQLKSQHISQMCHVAGDNSSLPVNSITALYKDRNKNLWAGSVRGGLFSIKETYIRTYKDVALGSTNGLSEKAVISLYEEKDGKLWIGTDGGGINLYNPQTNKFTHFNSTYGDKVASVTSISNTEMMVSLYTKGIFIFNKETQKYRPFVVVNDSINYEECFYGYLPLANQVADDKIYIISYHAYVYHPKSHTFSPMPVDKSLKTVPDALRLTYSNNSFSLLKRENQAFIVPQKNDSISLLFELGKEETIISMSCDKNYRVWTGTDKGLGYYDIKEKKYHPIPTKLFNSVSYLLSDGNGHLWIGAQNMLFSYITEENKFTLWNSSDGFLPNEILFVYQKPCNKDFIYLGGAEGLVKINTHLPLTNAIQPEICLASVYYNGSPYMRKMEDNTIRIPWNYNSLSIQVRIKSKDLFQKNLLRYTIRSKNDQYIESYDPEINLSSLSPGKYELWVSCNTKEGNYTEPIRLVDIIITPAWYKTIWFIGTIGILFICIAIGVAQFVYRKKEKKMKGRMEAYKQHVNEEKINFLINVNHELRTPLTLVYAPLKRLIKKNKEEFSPEYTMQQLTIVYRQVQRMKSIVNMVLDLNRLESGLDDMKMQEHSLNDWIKEIANDFSNESNEKSIRIRFQLDPQIGKVWYDEWKCQIILSNLLLNALKFSEQNTCITLTTSLRDSMVRIAVSDQGIGLQHTDLSKLFTRFYESTHTENGSGIGLSYSKILAEVHGGNIGAYNNPDRGATFYFELPLSCPVTANAVQSPADLKITLPDTETPYDLSKECAKHTLLVVEDEEELRNYLYDTLSESFKKVYAAEDAATALKICRTEQPGIVVSDVMMPGMNGYELCRKIKSDVEISHIPIILLTARCDEVSITLGYKLGADFYMAKPFEIDFLQTIICNILINREKKRHKYLTSAPITPPQESTMSKGDEVFMTKLNKIINDNLAGEELSIKFLTDAMAMSRASLYNKVKLLTGLGVNDYINRLRIEKSVYLLTHTDLSINEISYEVGFSYPRYFSTSFKQIKGITPTRFKEENKKNT